MAFFLQGQGLRLEHHGNPIADREQEAVGRTGQSHGALLRVTTQRERAFAQRADQEFDEAVVHEEVGFADTGVRGGVRAEPASCGAVARRSDQCVQCNFEVGGQGQV